MEKRIPDDKTWNVAPADTPHKIRFQPALMSLGSKEIRSLIPSGLVTVDIEAGSFGSLLKSRRKRDRAGAHCCCRRAACDTRLRQSHLEVVESNSALGAQLVPEDIAGILARPGSLRITPGNSNALSSWPVIACGACARQRRAHGLLEGDRTASGPARQWLRYGYFPPALTRLCIAKQNSRTSAILRFAAALRFRLRPFGLRRIDRSGFWSVPPAVW